jgi:DNA-binding MarR family transcriptional regulator
MTAQPQAGRAPRGRVSDFRQKAEQVPAQRVTPRAIEAEQSVLGAMLIEEEAISQAISWLAETDFYTVAHSSLFKIMAEMYLERVPVDMITLTGELRQRDELEKVGGLGYLSALIESCPNACNIESYAERVMLASQQRQALQAGERLSSMIYSGAGMDAIENTQAALEHIRERMARHQLPATITADQLLLQELKEPGWAVPGFVPQGFSILGGKMKQGKSWMALDLALAVASGKPFLGQAPTCKGPVLYLALEDSMIRLQQRTKMLLGSDPAPPGLHLQTLWATADNGGLERLERWLQQNPMARLVIIDVLQKFRASRKQSNDLYGDDYAACSALKRLGDKYGVAILVLHHLSKRDCEDPFEALTGTVGITGAADGLIVLERKRGKDDAVLHLTGRDIGHEKLALHFNNGNCHWELLGDAEEVGSTSARQQILDLLGERPDMFSPRDIVDELQLPSTTVRSALRRLNQEGLVNVKNHLYTLRANYNEGIAAS